MFENIYQIFLTVIAFIADGTKGIRAFVNFFDDLGYHIYRATGCYGHKWDPTVEYYPGVLRLSITKGRDIPRTTMTTAFSQYIHLRVTSQQDYCRPVVNTDGAPRFHMTSYFTRDLCANALIEITLCNDGMYVDRVAGRVSLPLKELCDVRSFHGWIALEDNGGWPAGFVYLESKMRLEGDAEYRDLKQEADVALGDEGMQRKRAVKGRSRDRETARSRVNKTRVPAQFAESMAQEEEARANRNMQTEAGASGGQHRPSVRSKFKNMFGSSGRQQPGGETVSRRRRNPDEERDVEMVELPTASPPAATN
ncbi:hypothetical protein GGI15_001506 [Coemansia interrupta]|uniref:C2 domain-containing protein n=1 Tax=Coemansia interrupta TaxID=1126814 RepID=A0A9W8HJQ1_9FUNG|nr:hypothetical protein GGI15_001506 [Coemansia interrupta]